MNQRLCLRRGPAPKTGPILGASIVVAAALFSLAPPMCARPPAQPAAQDRGNSPAREDAAAQNDLLAKAESAMNIKDYAAAAQAYQEYIAKKPDDAGAHFQLGYTYTAMQKMDAARVEYQKATELDPQMGEAFLNLGLTEVDTDQAAALTALRRAVDLMPDDAHPAFMLAAALDRVGQTPAAIDEYKAALSLDDQDPAIHKALGNALLRTGRASDAEPQFQAAAALDASDPEIELELAECLVAEHKLDEGTAEFSSYLKKKPGDLQTWFALVSLLIDLAKYDDALAQLDSDRVDAADIRALKLRYEALAGLKRNDEALAVLVKAEAVAPTDAEVHQKLGDSYLQGKNYSAAAREFQSVLKVTPVDGRAAEGLVAADYDAGDYSGALQAINLQTQQTPQSTLPLRSLFIRASCYDRLGDKSNALKSYDAFLSANRDQTSDMYFAAAERVRELRRESGNKK